MKANWKDIRFAPRDGTPILVIGVQSWGGDNHWRQFKTHWRETMFSRGWADAWAGECVILFEYLPALAVIGEAP